MDSSARSSSGSRKAKQRPEGKKKGQFGKGSSTFTPEVWYAVIGIGVLLLLVAIWGAVSTGRVLPHYPQREVD